MNPLDLPITTRNALAFRLGIHRAQYDAIQRAAAVYDDPELTACAGLERWNVDREFDAVEFLGEPGAIAVDFHYRRADVAGLGLEVVVIAADGTIVDSQDFG